MEKEIKQKCDLCGYHIQTEWFEKFRTNMGQSYFDVEVCQLCQDLQGQHSVLAYCTNFILDEITKQNVKLIRYYGDQFELHRKEFENISNRLTVIEKKLEEQAKK